MKKKIKTLSIMILCSLILLTGCKKKESIIITEAGDTITVNYDSYLQDGEIIDENKTETITLGQKTSFPIFDTELVGLKIGEDKFFTTKDPNEGYGIYHNDLKVQSISSTVINKIGTQPKIGEQINIGNLKGVIVNTSPVDITIDFNDRQTRENVEFHVTVLSIEKNVNE